LFEPCLVARLSTVSRTPALEAKHSRSDYTQQRANDAYQHPGRENAIESGSKRFRWFLHKCAFALPMWGPGSILLSQNFVARFAHNRSDV